MHLEQFLLECRKTETKAITLANHNKSTADNQMNQSEREANTCHQCQARENACRQFAIGFDFTSDWLTKWREIFLANAQQRKTEAISKLLSTFEKNLDFTSRESCF